MQAILWISLGAIVGANLRYFVGQTVGRMAPLAFPLGTLAINVSGSFVIGFFLALVAGRSITDPRWRYLIAIGFCGGYTTFSSYAYDTFVLLQEGRWIALLSNVVLSNVLCLSAVIAGAALARNI